MNVRPAVPSFPEIEVPDGPVRDPAEWRGPDLTHSTEWQYHFDGRDLAELDAALREVNRQDLGVIQMRGKRDFPLPRLGETLAQFRGEILDGRGFVLLRGLPVDDYSRLDVAKIYWGIGLHLGYPVVQNGKGHMLGHVVDLGSVPNMPASEPGMKREFIHTEIRGYNSRNRFFFHVDNADIVGLLCLHPAMQGGESLIVSSVAIHNEIQRRRPDLLRVLYQPFWVSRMSEVPAGARPYVAMPVFHHYQGRLIASYWRAWVEACKIFPELPPVTDEQRAAFDLIDELANDPQFHLSMDLEKGDIQFINNHVTLHTRTAYEDFPEPERKRHLLRLWLVSPEGRPLPDWFYEYYGAGRRGGIYVAGVTEVASLEP